MQNNQPDKSIKTFNWLGFLPYLLSIARLVILPHLVFSFLFGHTYAAYFLFLLAISSDLFDGQLARRFNATSKLGTYFDATIDFIFIIGMFMVFVSAGLYNYWILPIILFMYIQFLVTGFFFKKIYDPIGKYYGSLLFGGIGLTLLFQVQTMYSIVTLGIIATTIAAILSRLIFFLRMNQKGRV